MCIAARATNSAAFEGVVLSDMQSDRPPKVAPWNDPAIRGYASQAILLSILMLAGYGAATNAVANMRKLNILTDFGFLENTASFGINQSLISYSAESSNFRVFWVGLLNTLLVAAIGIVFTTILGFSLGIARLSKNWMVARLATVYVETLRNIPLLLQLLFIYNAVPLVLGLPEAKRSIPFASGFFVNQRGIVAPYPEVLDGFWLVWVALGAAIAGSYLYSRRAAALQSATGRQSPVLPVTFALLIGLPVLAYFIAGMPVKLEFPELGKFNLKGGFNISLEFIALTLGLVLYTATYIAEIVRAGILAVSHGQTEAAHALGLQPGPTLNLVVIPQAMRIIIPPLTSQYLNLTKNSTLAVFIGYADLVNVFAGSVLNNTGAAVQIMAMTMAVYLFISLVTSFAMNVYNARSSLVER